MISVCRVDYLKFIILISNLIELKSYDEGRYTMSFSRCILSIIELMMTLPSSGHSPYLEY